MPCYEGYVVIPDSVTLWPWRVEVAIMVSTALVDRWSWPTAVAEVAGLDREATVQLTPTRIAAIYAVLGLAALYGSDVLIVRYLEEPTLSRVQTVKGAVEVGLTAGLILVLTTHSHRQLRSASDRLDRQRLELQLLHRVLRHNLRNDLNVIGGHAAMLREERGERKGEVGWRCGKIIETAEKMHRYTDMGRLIRRATEVDDRIETFSLRATVDRAIDRVGAPAGADIATAVPSGASVRANPLLEEALAELVRNAIEHDPDPAPTVRVEAHVPPAADGSVEICVIDDGPGIPPGEVAPLRRGREAQLLHLTGMGLWFVNWTVELSGGSVVFEPDDGGGTTVRLRLPGGIEAGSAAA